MNRSDLKKLSLMRLREAKSLLTGRSKSPCGAYYLAGYAVECAIKACIAKKTRQFEFPDKGRAIEAYEHTPEKLIKAAELTTLLSTELRSNLTFARYWSLIKEWRVESRYETNTTQIEALQLIQAIDDPTNGVLQWLKNYW